MKTNVKVNGSKSIEIVQMLAIQSLFESRMSASSSPIHGVL